MTAIGPSTSRISSHPPWWATSATGVIRSGYWSTSMTRTRMTAPVSWSATRTVASDTRGMQRRRDRVVRDAVRRTGETRFRAGSMVVRPLPKVPDMSSMRTRVEETIEVIRPALHADGGDIVLRDVDEETGIVRVTLVGACGTCPTSTTTLKAGIERIMRDRIDGVTEVVNVPDLPEPSTLGEA